MAYAHARHECVVTDHVKHRRRSADGGKGTAGSCSSRWAGSSSASIAKARE